MKNNYNIRKKIHYTFLAILICSCSVKNIYNLKIDGMHHPNFKKENLTFKKKIRKFKKNDLIAFNEEFLSKKYLETWILRIIAVGGDKVEIKNGDIRVNDSIIHFPYEYRIIDMLRKKSKLNLKKIGMDLNNPLFGDEDINPLIDMIIEQKHKSMFSTVNNNSPEFFGQIIIPCKHDTVFINEKNKTLFRKLFEIPECKLIDSFPITINERLYFVMGDDRKYTLDSRYIGLVPESAIISGVKFKSK